MFVFRVLFRWCAATMAVGSFASMIALAACSSHDSTQGGSQSTPQLGDPDATCPSFDAGCPAPFTACQVNGSPVPICVNTVSDPTNCGACGKVCPTGTPFCIDSTCANGIVTDAGIGCPPPFTNCPVNGVPVCTDTVNNPFNCGTCGNVCPAGQTFCINGTCTNPITDAGITCPPPFTNCPINGVPVCTDTVNNPFNCGACGNVCPTGKPFCINGTCTSLFTDGGITCTPPLSNCPVNGIPLCTDTTSNPFNCGACGNACPTGRPFCINGTCTDPPPDPGSGCPNL